MPGAVVSTTVTVKLAGAEVLLAASVAVQDTSVEPSANVEPELWSQLTLGDGSTRSVAVTENVTAAPPRPVASAVTGPLGTDTAGAVMSAKTTVTLKVALPGFTPSLAVHVTTVVPTAKCVPDAGRQVTGGEPATASDAVAPPYETFAPPESPVVTLTSAGTDTTGAVVSATVTLNVCWPETLFDASFAVHATAVVPSGKLSPDEWSHVTDGAGSTRSVAVTEKGTFAPEALVASAVTALGTDNVGGVESTRLTVTLNVALPVFGPSLAVHKTDVVPTEKFEPEVGEHVTGGEPATASVALAAPYDTAVPPGSPVVTVTGAGGVTTGGVVSTTETVNDPVGVPVPSTQSTAVFPSGNVEPEGGVQVKPSLSYEYGAPAGPVASTVTVPLGKPSGRADASGVAQAIATARATTRGRTLSATYR
jgi:hypothetical protein